MPKPTQPNAYALESSSSNPGCQNTASAIPFLSLSLSAANGTQAGTKPWAATRSTSEGGVTWERPGRVWGLREIVELHQDVKRAWVEATACQDLVVMV